MKAKLYIVGTPIGNRGDLTFRAAEVLRDADIVACEDTRHSRPLLSEIGAKGQLIAYHKFNEAECARKIADYVANGKSVALVTDAGMPSVSDPAGLPIVVYVAPHDVKELAAELGGILGDRKVYAVREMTKIHECVEESTLLSFACEERGEIVLVIEGAEEENPLLAVSPEEHLAALIEAGVDRKEAVKRVAAERGVPKNEIYKLTVK